MKSADLLADFIDYCHDHPSERFWQALRNWSGQAFILAGNSPDAKRWANDTFYWDARDGLRHSVNAE